VGGFVLAGDGFGIGLALALFVFAFLLLLPPFLGLSSVDADEVGLRFLNVLFDIDLSSLLSRTFHLLEIILFYFRQKVRPDGFHVF